MKEKVEQLSRILDDLCLDYEISEDGYKYIFFIDGSIERYARDRIMDEIGTENICGYFNRSKPANTIIHLSKG